MCRGWHGIWSLDTPTGEPRHDARRAPAGGPAEPAAATRPRRAHASSPRCAGSARPAVGRRRARTRRRVYGRNCVGRDAGVVGDETGPVSVVSSREARCEAWRGSDVRHRGPRSASPRPPWSQTRVRRRTRDETEVRGAGGWSASEPARGGPGRRRRRLTVRVYNNSASALFFTP